MGWLVRVNNNEIHKTRENRIKTLFKAPDWNLRLFSSASLIFGGQLALLTLIIVTGAVTSIQRAESKQTGEITFGRETSINVFPGEVRANDWTGLDQVLLQELSDFALYQDFDNDNSASLILGDDTSDNSQNEPNFSNEHSGNENAEELSPDGVPVDDSNQPEPVPEVQSKPEPQPEESNESTEPISFNGGASWGVFTQANTLYPLAQLSVTSTPSDALEEGGEPALSPEDMVPAPSVESSPESDIKTATSTEEKIVSTLPPRPSDNDITFSDFSTVPLEPGQFITGLKLRFSLGAKLKHTVTENAPFIEVLYGPEAGLESIGIILLDDEITNAINGGYFMFEIPGIHGSEDLASAQVSLRYHGDRSLLDGLYLDSVWFEMNTKIINAEDLYARGVADQLKHLKAPDISVLLSDQLNFSRDEAPVFNLRYESPQNFIVRGFMKLIGRSSITIEEVMVNHETIGNVPVRSKVNVTREGLVTLELSEEDLGALPPGTYEISVVYKENGFEYTDSFDFQWGILSINPRKSEYAVGDTAFIDMGALSLNGNTICDALLDLYVTDPAGFITKATVEASGECNGNNITDVPDYTAEIPVMLPGDYQLYLERIDETGAVIGFTNDTVKVAQMQSFSIERTGPTRIFPKVPYKMELTVSANEAFDGVLKERVPASFVVSSTTAEITQDGDWQILSWDISMQDGGITLAYSFDAPDISPYLYNLGAASLEGERQVTREVTKEVVNDTASSTEGIAISATSTVTEQITSTEKWAGV